MHLGKTLEEIDALFDGNVHFELPHEVKVINGLSADATVNDSNVDDKTKV